MNKPDSRRVLAEGKYLRLVNEQGWDYAERTHADGAVVIVAVTDQDRLILTEQYRIPVAARVIELPAGIVGDEPGREKESLDSAARRELLEETGFEAGKLIELASGPPSAGFSSELVTFFLATRLRQVHAGGGVHHEQIQVHEVPLKEAGRWLEDKRTDGWLVDPKIYAALYFLQERSCDE